MKLSSSLLVIVAFSLLLSCKKEPVSTSFNIPPHLTERLWKLDTILINLPATYDNLTDLERFNYDVSLAWAKDKAQVNFRDNGDVNCSGDWDFGYTRWELINNSKDIKANRVASADTLRTWQASDTQFSYIHSINDGSFECTFIFK